MGRNIVKAKLDIIFKKLFSDKNNEDLLHDFLSSMLEIPYDDIKHIVVENSEILPDSISGKFSRLDIRMTVDNRLVNCEMQIAKEDAFRDRSLFYWSKMYSGDLKSGDEYDKLKQSISINIINFNEFDTPDFHSVFKLINPLTGEQLTDKCAIHFFELKKINKQVNKNNRMELWLQLINAESEEELDMLQQTEVQPIQKAVMIIHQMSDDEKIQELARLREKALHDEASALSTARKEGRAEGEVIGVAKGRAEERNEMIAKMLKNGMTDEQINKILSE
jgi:predicted transposase/invertase (TIGR01784 family)